MDIRKYAVVMLAALLSSAAEARPMVSPNGKLSMEVRDGQFVIAYQDRQVLQMKAAEAATPLENLKAKPVKTDYTMLSGKRSHCTNQISEITLNIVRLSLLNRRSRNSGMV